ncbi:MAG: CRISPR-associated protein Csx11 [Candidatus Methanospirareceae archaeon]
MKSEIPEELKKLQDNRVLILLVELMGFLHDLGKLDDSLYKEHQIRYSNDKKKGHIPQEIIKFFSNKNFQEMVNFHAVPEWLRSELSNQKIDGFERHHYGKEPPPQTFLEKIIANADNQDSSEDRGAREKQEVGIEDAYVSTPFGFEKKLSPDYVEETKGKCKCIIKGCLTDARVEFYNKLKEKGITSIDGYIKSRGNFIKLMEDYFSLTISESRRPANDILLFDHCYMTGTMAKSVISGCILDDEYLNETRGKIREKEKGMESYFNFKLLIVGFRGYDFLTNVYRLPDFVGRAEKLKEIQKKVRDIVEIEYPIGNLIYEDSEVMCFLTPALKDKKIEGEIENSFRDRIEGEINEMSNGILLPFVKIVGREDRDGPSPYIGPLLKRSKEIKRKMDTYVPNRRLRWMEEWNNQYICFHCSQVFSRPKRKNEKELCPICSSSKIKKREKCQVCGYAPESATGEGILRSKGEILCESCFKTRVNGSNHIHKLIREGNREILWLDELRDESPNNRIALIIGKVTPIDKWLSGELVETLKNVYAAKTDKLNLRSVESDIKGLLGKKDVQTRWRNIKKILEHSPAAIRYLEQELNKLGSKGLTKDEIRTLTRKLIEKVNYISYQKSPSPSRLRRIWQEFLEFSEDSETSLKNFFEEQKLIRKRIKMKVDGEIKKKEYMLGDAKLEGKDIGCVIYEGERTILTANYLDTEFEFDGEKQKLNEYSKEDLKDLLKGKILEIKWYDGTSTEAKIEEVVNIESYIPVVPVYKTVGEFMILCPAKYALTLTTRIKAHFFKRFEKALGKLGLNIGLLYFKYKQPLYLVLDGGRRFIEEFESEDLRKEDETREYEILKNEDVFIVDKLGWNITPKFEDGSEDWYYCTLKDAITNEYVPILKMKDNKIKVFHNYFDYEYMESTQKRFDITFGKESKRFHSVVGEQGPRPYLLEDVGKIIKLWDIIDPENGNLTISQIMKLKHICSEKIEEWGLKNKNLSGEGTFRTLVEASVENICGDIGKSEKETIIRSVIEGYFFDVVELFIKLEQILSPFDVISFFADFQYNKEEGERAERWLLKQVGGLNAR